MNILLVDDERDVRLSLSRFLKKLGYQVDCACNGSEGLNKFHLSSYDLIITDIRMPSLDGIEFLRHVKEIEHSLAEVIIITGHGDMDNAVKSLKYGANDYFMKPIDVRELASAVKRCVERHTPRKTHLIRKKEVSEEISNETVDHPGAEGDLFPTFQEGSGLDKLGIYSDDMRRVINLAEKYNRHRSINVLLEGETGTGKELVARYIHYIQKNGLAKPFVAINCAALPENLFEAELFGHEKGAYTGASTTGQKGKLDIAEGGTIFFDEIGELPLNLQVKLLRFIEEKKFFRIGGIREVAIDVRIISATNKNLSEEVSSNRFRPDLFYRLNMVKIRIPPLRDRQDDILPLAIKFLKKVSPENWKNFKGFTSAAEDFLLHHPWPGNVRQLENTILNLSLRGFGDIVDVDDISFIADMSQPGNRSGSLKPVLGNDEFELPSSWLRLEELNRTIIKRALHKNCGNITHTAQYLDISRRVLQGRLKKMGLS
ncbi:MAG: sigma-54 dependent transcriptional regulator [Pseudomonadota bacterium]